MLGMILSMALLGHVTETPNFIVEAPTEPEATSLANHAEACRDAVCELWLGETKPPWKYPVPIATGYGDYVAGQAKYMSDRSNIFHVLEVTGPTPAARHSIVLHEVTHVTMWRYFIVRGPRWLDEGLAVATEVILSEYPSRYNDACSDVYLRSFFSYYSIPLMLDGDVYYGQAASVLLYLYDTYGRSITMEFLETGLKYGWDLSCVKVLNTSFDDLDKEWRRGIKSGGVRYPRTWRYK